MLIKWIIFAARLEFILLQDAIGMSHNRNKKVNKCEIGGILNLLKQLFISFIIHYHSGIEIEGWKLNDSVVRIVI